MMTLGAAQFGLRMILARLFDPSRLLDVIEAERVDYLIGVPTMLIGLLEEQAARPRDLSSVRRVVSGGAMVPPDLVTKVRDAFGCSYQTVYAQTESSPVLTQSAEGDSIERLCDTVGQPLPQTSLSIRDPRTNLVVPLGEVGEICAQSYGVMIGYNQDPEATARAIDGDGWLHTGDLGTMDSRGYVRITGRVKDMIIRGGENLFPAEIEAVILEHSSVAEAAVVGMPDEKWGEVAVAFVRLSDGNNLDEAGLVAHCRERIAAQKTPARWVAVSEWPLTGSGKIQKFVLRERLVAGAYDPPDQPEPIMQARPI
jgi:fatty-acyl-CoA synthase